MGRLGLSAPGQAGRFVLEVRTATGRLLYRSAFDPLFHYDSPRFFGVDYSNIQFPKAVNSLRAPLPGDVPNDAPLRLIMLKDGVVASASCLVDVGGERRAEATPPVITCPSSITVECTTQGGTASDDVQLTGFFSGASATDNCDPDVRITNNAPPTIDLGSTPVTFTATDDNGNSSQCIVTVKVQDTTAPVLSEASADPDVLWPPNHTLRDVDVDYTVSDACSPVTCDLTVASDEPEVGTGRGDIAPDWLVVDDHHVLLRAERAGTGDGRTYTISTTCADDTGNESVSTATVLVMHDMRRPASGAAFRIGTLVNFAGSFWDVPGKSHTAQWMFDNLTAPGVVIEPTDTKPGTVKGTYSFVTTGVYAVQMNVTDQIGATGTADAVGGVNSLVVIFDPNGGYVTGGGWIDSPPGAFVADPELTGKVNFGFVSKYFKNALNPKGETEFDFRVADFRFNALNFDSLVVSGPRIQYTGFGKVNGGDGYRFILTAIDGQASGGGGVDKFRMKIWNKVTGTIIYDSQMGALDNANPTTPVGIGSNIVIYP
jgi:hypothetical protein